MVDCDRDAVVFVVKQHGDGFCHREMNSCFGPSSGLTLLSETLASRFVNAPEGSYTKRLFMDAGAFAPWHLQAVLYHPPPAVTVAPRVQSFVSGCSSTVRSC